MRTIILGIILFASTLCQAETLTLVAVTNYKQVAAYIEVIEFVTAVLKDAGFKVEVVEVPRKRGALTVNSGEFDALPIRGLDDSKDLPNVIVTSFPIAFTNFRVVALQSNKTFSEKTLKDSSGAVVLNNSSLRQEIQKRKLKVSEVNVGYLDLVKMLAAHRVDYVVMPEEFIASISDSDKATAKTWKVSPRVFIRTPLYFTMNKKHQGKMPKIEESFRRKLSGDLDGYKYIRHSLNSSSVKK